MLNSSYAHMSKLDEHVKFQQWREFSCARHISSQFPFIPTSCKFPQIQFVVQHIDINSTRYVEKVSKWSKNSRVLQFRLVHFPSWKRALSACTGRCCSHTFDNWMFCPFFWQKFYVWWKSLLMACETYISSPACDLERLLSFYCLSQWLDRTAVSLLSPGVTDSYMLVKLGWAL